MPNFFEDIVVKNSLQAPSCRLLEPGTYRALLKRINTGQGPKFGGKGLRRTLSFIFETIPGGVVVCRTVSKSLDPRSKLFELAGQLAGASLDIASLVNNGETFSTYLEGLIGREFLINVQPSDNGRFNNLIGVIPAPANDDK